MKKHPIAICFLQVMTIISIIIFSAAPVYAADIILPEELPGGFTLTREVEKYDSNNLFDLINGQAIFYISYGFTQLDHAFYEKDGETYKVDVYQVADDLSALGCYREQMDIGTQPIDAGTEGYTLDYLAAFYKKIFYVEIVPNADGIPDDLKALATAVDNLLPGEAKLPDELSLFPIENLIEGSETYMGESLLSYSFMGPGLRAEYQLPGAEKKLRVFVAISNSPDSAEAISNEFAAKLNDTAPLSGDHTGNGIMGELPYRGTSIIFTSGRYAYGCIDATDVASAMTVLEKLASNLAAE